MSEIILCEKNIHEYIGDTINDCVIGKIHMAQDLYHHNTSYGLASSVIKHGILSMGSINRLGIRKYSDEFLRTMSDIDSHVNGQNGVSLSLVGLTDLYPNEDEYDPFKENFVDFLVTKNIKTYRMTIHYGNEFVTNDIAPDKLLSLAIRLLKYMERLKTNKIMPFEKNATQQLIEAYNNLLESAKALKQTNLNVPIREMSNNDNLSLDIEKLSQSPKILIKK